MQVQTPWNQADAPLLLLLQSFRKRPRTRSEASRFSGSHWYKQNKTNYLPSFIDRCLPHALQWVKTHGLGKIPCIQPWQGMLLKINLGFTLLRTTGDIQPFFFLSCSHFDFQYLVIIYVNFNFNFNYIKHYIHNG